LAVFYPFRHSTPYAYDITYTYSFPPGEVGLPNEFMIWTREAGAGGLSIAMEGPAKAEIDFEDRKDGSCSVSYVTSEPGEYLVSIKFNDQHIPDSPFKVPISPGGGGDAQRMTIQQLREKGLQVGYAGSCGYGGWCVC
jgi:filamin